VWANDETHWIYYAEHPTEWEKNPMDGKKNWPYFGIHYYTETNNSKQFFPLMRISEMYLIYAEAANQANGSPTQKAVDYLNAIIDRANTPIETPWAPLNAYTNIPGTEERASIAMSKTEFNEKVFLEREWELCFEYAGYFDLLRTRRLETWPPEATTRYFKPSDYLFPIPPFDAEFIGQNPGYE
jgi:hypothetical protein